MPTTVVIASIIKNKNPNTFIDIYIVTADLSDESIKMFSLFESDSVRIIIKKETTADFHSLHNFSDGTQKTRITTAALLKFKLSEIITETDKLLYMDCDVIVCEDLFHMYSQDINDYFCAAVLNTTRLYLTNNSHHMHTYMLVYKDYFNSGVLLLNLKKMREENSSEKLLRAKVEMTDAYFMDQDQLNAVFDGYVKLLPIRYNAQYVNLERASSRFDISALNIMYGTNYDTLQDVAVDAAIVHYASADKPWLSMSTPLAAEWYEYYLYAKKICPGIAEKKSFISKKQSNLNLPKVSIIIHYFNADETINNNLDNIKNQTLKDIQIICIDDGSTDSTLEKLYEHAANDNRIQIINKRNQGFSSSINAGLSEAEGEYIYIFDSDATLTNNALELLYDHAKKHTSQIIFFDGEVNFDNDELRDRYTHLVNLFTWLGNYPDIYKGDALYPKMVEQNDFTTLPWIMFFERKYLSDNNLNLNPSVYYAQDNLFTMQALLLCERVSYLPTNLYKHKIHENSVMIGSFNQKKMLSHYISLIDMIGFLAQYRHKISDFAIIATKNSLDALQKKIYKKDYKLPKRQRIQPMLLDPYLNVVSNVIYFPLQSHSRKSSKKRSIFKRMFVSTAYGLWFVVGPLVRRIRFLSTLAEKFHNRYID